jgi:hypothetical protein
VQWNRVADHISTSFADIFRLIIRAFLYVVIKNKPFAKISGAAVAGPVFKEVSDKLMSQEMNSFRRVRIMSKTDSAQFIVDQIRP